MSNVTDSNFITIILFYAALILMKGSFLTKSGFVSIA